MALFTIRSERALMEQIGYNLMFRWFVGFCMDDGIWNHSTVTKNRDRLLAGNTAVKFFIRIKQQAETAGLLADEHFSVDGTLLYALASVKSFHMKDDDDHNYGSSNKRIDVKGKKRHRATHQSTTDPEARFGKKSQGQAAIPCYVGNIMIEDRNGLVVDAHSKQFSGTAATDAAIEMLANIPGNRQVTLAADKKYDTKGLVKQCQAMP